MNILTWKIARVLFLNKCAVGFQVLNVHSHTESARVHKEKREILSWRTLFILPFQYYTGGSCIVHQPSNVYFGWLDWSVRSDSSENTFSSEFFLLKTLVVGVTQ